MTYCRARLWPARAGSPHLVDPVLGREGGLDVEFWSIYMGKREGDGTLTLPDGLEYVGTWKEAENASDRKEA